VHPSLAVRAKNQSIGSRMLPTGTNWQDVMNFYEPGSAAPRGLPAPARGAAPSIPEQYHFRRERGIVPVEFLMTGP